jgi:hypothetical protein
MINRCPICKTDSNIFCTCGICPSCIETYTHNECQKMMNKGFNDVKGSDTNERKN